MSTSRPLATARTVSFKSAAEMIAVLGPSDAHVSIIEDYFEGLQIIPKDLDLLVTGPSESVTPPRNSCRSCACLPATIRRSPPS